jgi:hypothetical protein
MPEDTSDTDQNGADLPPDDSDDPPALSDADLAETLDLLATVVASVSDRVDAQTAALDRLTKTTAEARQAAFAAQAQTDPKLFAKPIGQAVREQLEIPLDRLNHLQAGFSDNSRQSLHRLDELASARADLLNALQAETAKMQRRNKRAPFMAIGALVLVLALAIIVPRVFATNPTVCVILGGDAVGGSCMFFGE